jgi:hypothetical protein
LRFAGLSQHLLFTRSKCRGKYWLGIRTACEPLFHSTALASYAPMMNEAITQLLDKMQAAANSGEGKALKRLVDRQRASSCCLADMSPAVTHVCVHIHI